MKKKQAEQLPDHLRCRKTDGRKWRCYKRVMEGKNLCEVHYPKTLARNRKPKEIQPLPDNLRCNRNDGRKWRCERRVMDSLKLCEAHHLQSQLRSNREEVPESLKIKRRRKVGALGDLKKKLKKKKNGLGVFEEKMVEKVSLKKGDLHFELMKVFLKRQIEGRKQKKWDLVGGFGGGELVRDLPNGLMAISSVSVSGFSNAGLFSERKLEMGSGPFVQHCFRSKNVEVPRIGSLQVTPCGGNVVQSRREGKMNCHRCGRRDDVGIVQCLSCLKESICMVCVGEEWYCEVPGEVKIVCPVCCGTCKCKTCSSNKSKDGECQDLMRDQKGINKILHSTIWSVCFYPYSNNLIWNRGLSWNLSDNCRTSIVNFHRSCSYDLCLQCCQEICCGNLPGGLGTNIFEFIDREQAYMHDGKPLLDMKTKQIRSFKKRCFNTSLVCSTTVPNWKANIKDGRIFCPPREFGGCGNNVFDLRCVLLQNWNEELK